MLEINKDEHQLQILMMRLQHVLHRQIAEVNHNEVWDKLYDLFTDINVVIINREQFNIFKEYEKRMLDMNNMFVKNPISIDEDKKDDK